jgi:hypothetical protein
VTYAKSGLFWFWSLWSIDIYWSSFLKNEETTYYIDILPAFLGTKQHNILIYCGVVS